MCKEEVDDNHVGIKCDACKLWFHSSCLHMLPTTYQKFIESSESWSCMRCRSIMANKINKWGELISESTIKNEITKFTVKL